MIVTYRCAKCGDLISYNPERHKPNIVHTLRCYYSLCDDCYERWERILDKRAQDFVLKKEREE